MRNAIIVDIDGTLSNPEHRLHHVKGEKKDFKAFYGEMEGDTVNEWCQWVIDKLKQDVEIILCTGRPAAYRHQTVKWLSRKLLSWDRLLMRPADKPHEHDWIIKKEIYDNNIKDKYNVLFVIDDRQQVVDMWRREGLVCLQCAKGDF